MMLASLMAGMAFFNADVGAVHCLAEALGGRYDTPHGVANAVFLPFVFVYNAENDTARHAAIALALDPKLHDLPRAEAAVEGGSAIKALGVAVGIPALRELPGVDPADFPAIAQAAEANLSNRSNARPMTAADYEEILQLAWED
jgi:alcohol dehydrogenase